MPRGIVIDLLPVNVHIINRIFFIFDKKCNFLYCFSYKNSNN